MKLELEIVSMGMEEAFKMFVLKAERDSMEYLRARFGTNREYQFDIYDYFENNYSKKQKTGEIIIDNNVISKERFFTEIEEREKIIKRALLELYGDENFLKERVMPEGISPLKLKGGLMNG